MTVPLIFVLSAGSDPTGELYIFAGKKGVELSNCSLGQGQGKVAEKLIEQAVSAGCWVLLQNCHLAEMVWLPTLERMIEELSPDTTDPNFRLWLTSYPAPQFPVSILENGVKMTNEPPKGLKANLFRSYLSGPICDSDFFDALMPDPDAATAEANRRHMTFLKGVFALCFFHAQIQERRNFGPLGWNVPYEFNQSDLAVSLQQLRIYVSESDNVAPWEALRYVTGQCNYGGRVTDAKDRVTLNTLLDHLYCDGTLEDNRTFTESGLWMSPPQGTYDEYVEFVKGLPPTQLPEAFGLHANADISKDQQESLDVLETAVTARSGAGGGSGAFDEEIISAIADDLVSRLPPDFRPEYMALKYPVDYHECMNTVLVQEATRYNVLLQTVRTSSRQIQRATVGLEVMSTSLEQVAVSLTCGQVPFIWKACSFPTIKPLASYTKDFLARLNMLIDWYENGAPQVFWLSGFFFMQSFTTAAKQNYAEIKTPC